MGHRARKELPLPRVLRVGDDAEIQGSAIVSHGGFGGPAAPYAVFVHEDLSARHATGAAKFYESALLEAIPTLEGRLGEALSVELQRVVAKG